MKIPKKIRKNFKELIKSLSGIIFSQNRMRWIEKERKKKFVPNSVLTRFGKENSEKYSKKFQKLKYLFPALFLAKTGVR